jgi:hypothetical protein
MPRRQILVEVAGDTELCLWMLPAQLHPVLPLRIQRARKCIDTCFRRPPFAPEPGEHGCVDDQLVAVRERDERRNRTRGIAGVG